MRSARNRKGARRPSPSSTGNKRSPAAPPGAIRTIPVRVSCALFMAGADRQATASSRPRRHSSPSPPAAGPAHRPPPPPPPAPLFPERRCPARRSLFTPRGRRSLPPLLSGRAAMSGEGPAPPPCLAPPRARPRQSGEPGGPAGRGGASGGRRQQPSWFGEKWRSADCLCSSVQTEVNVVVGAAQLRYSGSSW